jgi:hypothetical protein
LKKVHNFSRDIDTHPAYWDSLHTVGPSLERCKAFFFSNLKLNSYVLILVLIDFKLSSYIQVIRADKTGYLREVYSFLKQNWKSMKWVALGVVTLEVIFYI